jgi:hypothetical protein
LVLKGHSILPCGNCGGKIPAFHPTEIQAFKNLTEAKRYRGIANLDHLRSAAAKMSIAFRAGQTP